MDPIILVVFMMVTGTTHGTVLTDSTADQSCNSCCQGLPGNNGIPGPAGIPGSPGQNGVSLPGRDGRDGAKGELGSKGEPGENGIGEIGLPGPQGPSGDSGRSGERGQMGIRGLPGKTGPIGLAGVRGSFGEKGDQGEPGGKGESGRSRKSAFMVRKTRDQTASSSNEIVTFNTVQLNIGNHFDLSTDRFTCQVPGTYVFMYSLLAFQSGTDLGLVKDGVVIVRTYNQATYDQLGSNAIIAMDVGEQVWIRFDDSGEKVNCGGNRCQFAGHLLYED